MTHPGSQKGHEPNVERIPIRFTMWAGLYLAIMVVAVAGVAWVMYPRLESIDIWTPYQGGHTGPFSERQSVTNGRPRLQVDEDADINAYRKRQDTLLTGYGWVDRSAGVVRIPVERAMELFVAEQSSRKASSKESK